MLNFTNKQTLKILNSQMNPAYIFPEVQVKVLFH